MTTSPKRTLTAAIVLAAAALFPVGAQAQVEPGRGGPSGAEAPPFVPGELLVRFRPAVDGGERGEVRDDEDVDLQESLPVPGLQLVQTEPGTPVGEAVRALEDRPEVAYAHPNFVREVAARPEGEHLFDELWGLDNKGQRVTTSSGSESPSGEPDADIDAPQAWDVTTGSEGVQVAVVDGGVDYRHPDLAGNMWVNAEDPPGNGDEDRNGRVDDTLGWDFCGSHGSDGDPCEGKDDRNPMDAEGHGTHVAGTIGADGTNGGGLPGVNWDTSLMAVRVANASGFTNDALLVEGFTYAADNGARVVNASFGGKGPAADEALQQVVRRSPDTLFVVAAGNGTNNDGEGVNNDKHPDFLCNIEAANLVCVTASTQSDDLASFANYGVRSVDLAAPGVNILSTVPPTQGPFGEEFATDPFGSTPRWTTADPLLDPQAAWEWTEDGDALSGDPAVTDSEDTTYAPSTTSDVTSQPFALNAPEPGLCTVTYEFQLDVDGSPTLDGQPGDHLVVEALDPGSPSSPVVIADHTEDTGPVVETHTLPRLGASDVQLRFRLITDDVGTADGATVDDVAVDCGGYDVMNGTSMATPHVAGAAALGFAYEDGASPPQMKCALTAGVDPIPNPFAFTTASGGRLDAARTLELLDPAGQPAACITMAPPRRGSDDGVSFRFQASQPGADFQCRLDGSSIPCGSLLTRTVGDGDHALQVRAVSSQGRTVPWTNEQQAPIHRFLVDTAGPAIGMPGSRLELSGRRIPVRLRCPGSELSGPCTGTVRLRSSGRIKVDGSRRTVTFGTARFSISPGDASAAVITVSRSDRRLIERRGRLAVTARAVAFDSLGNRAVREKSFELSD